MLHGHWSAGPISRQSFSDRLLLLVLTDASYTICSFVLSTFSWITALCGNRILACHNLLHHWLCPLLPQQVVLESLDHKLYISLFLCKFCSKFYNPKLPNLLFCIEVELSFHINPVSFQPSLLLLSWSLYWCTTIPSRTMSVTPKTSNLLRL